MPIYYGNTPVSSVYLGSTSLAGFLGEFSLTGPPVILPPLPVINNTTGSVNNSDSIGKLILDLPDLTENETRTYQPDTGPAFQFGSSGDLIRGNQSFIAGTYTGKIIQNNGQSTRETSVTITATDVPVLTLTSPPPQTADDTPLIAGYVTWRDHSVSGLTIYITVDGTSKPNQTTDSNGNFSYEVTPALTANVSHSISVGMETPGVASAVTNVIIIDYDADTTAYLNAVQAAGYTPDNTWAGQVDTLIRSLKSGGVWAVSDRHLLPAVPDARAFICLKSRIAPTLANAPTFTPDRGYTGNGTNSYILSNFNPATGGPYNLVQDSANIRVYTLVAPANGNYHVGNSGGTIKVRARGGTNSAGSITSGTAITSTGTAVPPTFVHINRNNATTEELYVDGALNNTGVANSTAIVSQDISILRATGSFTTAQIAYVGMGGGMNASQIQAEYNAVKTYLQVRGAVI